MVIDVSQFRQPDGRLKFTGKELDRSAELRRYFRAAEAGKRLARIDWAKFRPERFLAADREEYLKIPSRLIDSYLLEYQRLSRGRV